ncbi:hypothetical protein IG631_09465 [Alternaria alternata]|nr:hypothetical protein IG631_09465 [Alternaria alternata]
MLDWRVMVRATPGRCDSRRKRGGCDGRATATEPDMLVVTELKLVNRQWGGRGTGSRPGQLQPTVVWPAVAGERDRGQAQVCTRCPRCCWQYATGSRLGSGRASDWRCLDA